MFSYRAVLYRSQFGVFVGQWIRVQISGWPGWVFLIEWKKAVLVSSSKSYNSIAMITLIKEYNRLQNKGTFL